MYNWLERQPGVESVAFHGNVVPITTAPSWRGEIASETPHQPEDPSSGDYADDPQPHYPELLLGIVDGLFDQGLEEAAEQVMAGFDNYGAPYIREFLQLCVEATHPPGQNRLF